MRGPHPPARVARATCIWMVSRSASVRLPPWVRLPRASSTKVSTASRDAQGHRGDAGGKEPERRKAVERAGLPGAAAEEGHDSVRRHQGALHFHVVAAGAAEPRGVPGVEHARLARLEERVEDVHAPALSRYHEAAQAIGRMHRTAEPRPAPADAIAVALADALSERREDAAGGDLGAAPVDLLGARFAQVGAQEAGGAADHDAPAGGGVAAPERLEDLQECPRRNLAAAHAARRAEVEEPGLRELGHQVRGQEARSFDLGALGSKTRTQAFGMSEKVHGASISARPARWHHFLDRTIHGPAGEWREARESRAHAGSQTRGGLLFRRSGREPPYAQDFPMHRDMQPRNHE